MAASVTLPAPAPRVTGTYLVRSPLAVVRQQGDRAVLIAPGTGGAFALDELGERLWDILGAEPLVPVLVERIRWESGRAARPLARQVLARLVAWQEVGLVAWR